MRGLKIGDSCFPFFHKMEFGEKVPFGLSVKVSADMGLPVNCRFWKSFRYFYGEPVFNKVDRKKKCGVLCKKWRKECGLIVSWG